MCNPLLLAAGTFAVSAASTMSQVKGQQQMFQQNAQLANQNAVRMYADTNQRMIQEQQSATLNKMDLARDARAARATAAAGAGESGVSGLSVDALMREFYGREASYTDRVDHQTDWTMLQMNNEMRGIQAQAKDRINSVQRPNFFDAGLRIAGAGLGATGTYYDMKAKMG
jgi:hypothetical protein